MTREAPPKLASFRGVPGLYKYLLSTICKRVGRHCGRQYLTDHVRVVVDVLPPGVHRCCRRRRQRPVTQPRPVCVHRARRVPDVVVLEILPQPDADCLPGPADYL